MPPATPEAIRFGLAAVKNVGEGAIESIVAAREGRGEISDVAGAFASLDDLCRRVDLRTVNKRVLESLVKAGAMASLGTPGALLARLDAALESGGAAPARRGGGAGDPLRPLRRARGREPHRHPSPRWTRTRSRARSACAGRRSSWGCTSPSIRWATSPTSCPTT